MMFSKSHGNESLRLRLWFLLPLASVLLITTVVLVLSIHRHVSEDIDRETAETARLAEHLYHEAIDSSASMLGTAMEVLATDQALHRGLADNDRALLLRRSVPLFAELRRKYAITHLYFSDANRVNILRAHQPVRSGDTISRETTLQAQRTRQTAYGVELGPLGTFTLRLVAPWFDADGNLSGFVELGMEIDHVLQLVQHIAGVKTFVLIDKQFLNRREWEAGARMLGRLPNWERFPDVVVNNQAAEDLPMELTRQLAESRIAERKTMASPEPGASAYRAIFLPVTDAARRNVGTMVMLLDVSAQMQALKRLTRESVLVGGIACLALFGLFYWLLGSVGRRLEQDTRYLLDLAEHDGLTGLYNHRMYYLRLDEEFVRRSRTGAPISLLLLDIDRFKSVNDRYGHLAGDNVLKTLGELARRSCRAMDIACRYGGEEITIILPETDAEGAVAIAERLRRTIEIHPFPLGDNKDGHITVSIGVATSSESIPSSTDLTESADSALYRAKAQGRNRVECATPCPVQAPSVEQPAPQSVL
ncbi:MAG: hypothetical protein H6R10_1344 [Rhodocyclaceae bacterium]|nr:hypothetical protein [Rhodocyclaceae bacterium]